MYRYSKEELESIVKNSFSLAECLRKLNIIPVGGNYKTLNKNIKKFNLSTDHFTGKLWSKGKKIGPYKNALKLEDILIENSTFTSSFSLKQKIIKAGLKSYICENCNGVEWMGKPIPLELEHCNGNNLDHRIENLKLLCPNCHAQTEFYRGRNKKKYRNKLLKESVKTEKSKTSKIKFFCSCGKEKSKRSITCIDCNKKQRISNIPNKEQLEKDFLELGSFLKVGKKYNVTDNTVRKWVKRYENS